MRQLLASDVNAIKAATVASYEAVGGVNRAAEALRIGGSVLTKYASLNEEWQKSVIRLDLAVQLDRMAGHPFLLNTMAQLVSGSRPAASGDVTARCVLRLDGILDDVVREVARAIDDERVDAGERQAIRRRIVAAQQELSRLDALMIGGG